MKKDRLSRLVVYLRKDLERGLDMTGEGPVISMPKVRGECSVPGCGRPHYAMGLCMAHYKRKRLGQALDVPIGQARPRLKPGAQVPVATKITPEAKRRLDYEAERQGVSPYVFLNMLIEKFAEVTSKHDRVAEPPAKYAPTKPNRKRKPRT